MAKHFRVIALDSRAQGRSSDSDQELSFSLMASDVAVLLDSLNIDSAFVLGWSDGGIVGLGLAFHYPWKIARLVTAGDRDIIIDTHTLALFHALPRAELCIVPGAHHGFFFEKPALANGIITTFLLSPTADAK